MQNFLELHLKPESRMRYGLPDISYPTPAVNMQSVPFADSESPLLAVMLHGLQQRNRAGEAQYGSRRVLSPDQPPAW